MTQVSKEGFRALRIFFTGVGGQGTLLATRLVGEAMLEEGIPVAMSEIHGMAQRGGVVESSVVAGNVAGPTIADGEADILMAFEPLEAVRAIPKCRAGSLVIASLTPVMPFTVAIGQSEYPAMETLRKDMELVGGTIVWADAAELAREAGSERTANIVMVGILAGTGQLPVSERCWQEALKWVLPQRVLGVNLKAFEIGHRFGSAALAG